MGDGNVLYPDRGGGYRNMYEVVVIQIYTPKKSILLYVHLKKLKFFYLKKCIYVNQQLPICKSKNRYTLNTLEWLPMVGLGK